MSPHSPPAPPVPLTRDALGLRILWLLIALISLPEVILSLSDWGLIGSRNWRPVSYTFGAFWSGLLGNWQPNYPGQPLAMFFSYSFLHASLTHLIGNSLALLWLGRIALEVVRIRWVLLLYGACTLGGALGFAALSDAPSPMVGASGALFGLAGAWAVWSVQDQHRAGQNAALYAAGLAGLLVVLNIGIWLIEGGLVAWETHLGGFVTGVALALCLPRRGEETQSLTA